MAGIDEHTRLLLHGESVTDSSQYQFRIENHGVSPSAMQSKFGGSSLYFGGNQYLKFPSAAITYGDGDFTIDWWEMRENDNVIFGSNYEQFGGLEIGTNRRVAFGYVGGNWNTFISDAFQYKPGVWTHCALVRSGGIVRTYQDGVKKKEAAVGYALWQGAKNQCLGTNGALYSQYYKGYVDEFRISDIARWTAEFTPPDKPYTEDPKFKAYISPKGASKTICGAYIGVAGKSKAVAKGYCGVGGVARQIYRYVPKGILISSLPIGSLVKSPGTKYNGAPIVFKIGTKRPGRIGLITDRIISLKCFDAKEPRNPDAKRREYGSNHYSVSNIDSWLNSTAPKNRWYSARHAYDAPPSNANVWSGYNEYEAEAGFLYNFEPEFRSRILDDTVSVLINEALDGGGIEKLTRKVRLLTRTEVGIGSGEGERWGIFTDAKSRMAYPTEEAVERSEYKIDGLSSAKPWDYWMSSVFIDRAQTASTVNTLGNETGKTVFFGNTGIRPALFLPADAYVSERPDTDGAYILRW